MYPTHGVALAESMISAIFARRQLPTLGGALVFRL